MLATAGVVVLVSFLLVRAWSLMWLPALISAGFFLWYGWAVYRVENGGNSALALNAMQARFSPVVEMDRERVSAGPAPTRRTA